MRRTEMLLNALVSLKLLEKRDGSYTNSPVAARFFVEGTADSARTGQLHTANLWKRWSTLTEAVRAGTAVAEPGSEWVGQAIHRGHGSQRAGTGACRGAAPLQINGAKRYARSGRGLGRILDRVRESCSRR